METVMERSLALHDIADSGLRTSSADVGLAA
ncbi:hypothetical protein GGR39_001243 [Novosphingobium fluoreni]|uniref:Uncharacterized protein n=1 Tax=Novosphingobium fluoreni TaxID=1391222 RepID=A0A7W6FXT6_9SPHN|nr:hypothetical protein [Novosphingobium fluoreni]